MKRFGFSLILFAFLVLGGTAFAGGRAEANDDLTEHEEHHHHVDSVPTIDAVELNGRKLQVAATTSIIGDVVSNIVLDAAELTVIMPLGQNPHGFSPSPSDVAKMEKADIVFVNGLELEENLLPILESLDGPIIVPVSAGIDVIERGGVNDEHHEDGEHEEGEDHHDHVVDPHTWFSPLNVMHWTGVVESSLAAADPSNHEAYEAAAETYLVKLKDLDREVREMVGTIPVENRKLVLDHAAIGYYARDYGFEMIGNIIPSFSDQSEPSARQVADMVELVRAENVQAIFVGGTASRGVLKLAESVAAETGRDNLPVVRFLTGSLTTAGGRGDTYLDFIRYNTESFVQALR